MKKINSFIIILLSAFLLASCSKIFIEHEETLELKVEDTHKLEVKTNDLLGLTYESSDDNIVVVNDEGVLYANSVGTATITLFSNTDKDVFFDVIITVVPKDTETDTPEPDDPNDPIVTTSITIEIEKDFILDDVPYSSFKFEIEDKTIITIEELTIFAINIGETEVTVINLENTEESYIITVVVTEKLPKAVVVGEKNKEGVYTSNVTVTLSIDDPDKRIQYKLFSGVPPFDWEVYRTPINIDTKGAYGLIYRVINRFGEPEPGPQQRLNLILDFIMDETYTSVIRYGKEIKYTDGKTITLPIYKEKDNEVRGIWVSTVSNIDINKYSSDESYKNQLITILDTIKANNLNTVFFQVRSMNDAFYPSEYAPYSRYIKGIEGEGLDWDILEFVIEEAHKRNLELHAWLNPYRVSSGGSKDGGSKPSKLDQLNRLHEDNFARKNPTLVLADEYNNLILNPASEDVRTYLSNIIEELLEKYDIDGIHFDDYFYIDTNEDYYLYSSTNHGFSNIEDWRRNNVNLMVKDISDLIKNHNVKNLDFVKFGISPAGIWANASTPGGSPTSGYASYGRPLYADTRKWVLEEWIDYIIPQVYWDFDNNLAPHADIVKWWANLIEDNEVDVALIIGQGLYRYRDSNPWTDGNAIVEQVRYASKYESVKGITFFTFKDLLNTNSNIKLTLSRLNDSFWTKPVDWPWASRLMETETSGEAYLIAKNILQNEYDGGVRIRGLIFDSEGKQPNELDKSKSYAESKYINALDDALDRAEQALNDPKTTINMLNNIASDLRKAVKDVRDNNFKGEK